MGLYDFTLYDVIARNALLYRDAPAWLDDGQDAPSTFSQVKTAVDRLAGALQNTGCRKGDRIGVVGKNCLAYFLVYGAAAALGAIVVPVNWRLSADEAAFILEDGAPRCVFSDDSNLEWTEAVRSKLADDLPFYNLQPGTGPFDTLALGAATVAFAPPAVDGDDGFVRST